MKRILTGVQPTGELHIGNYVGAIKPMIARQDKDDVLVFVASYHALTSITDPAKLAYNTRSIILDYVAFGIDINKCSIYKQHSISEVAELAWILSCICPTSFMNTGAHKDKIENGANDNMGLLSYPILQVADILIMKPDIIPIGKDQVQHLEIAKDLAEKFNRLYGNVFKIPEYEINSNSESVVGTDGRKMSKSYNNVICPFMEEKQLKKKIMSIVTDSKEVNDLKTPDTCNVFKMFSSIAGKEDERTHSLRNRYLAGGMGYGYAKNELFSLIMDHFSVARDIRSSMNINDADEIAYKGGLEVKDIASETMEEVRNAVGLI